jgi:cell division protein ZapA
LSITHRILVLGREISVRSTADEGTVRRIECFVNKRLEQHTSSTGDSQLTAILALLNLAEDYLALVDRFEADKKSEDARVAALLERLSAMAE